MSVSVWCRFISFYSEVYLCLHKEIEESHCLLICLFVCCFSLRISHLFLFLELSWAETMARICCGDRAFSHLQHPNEHTDISIRTFCHTFRYVFMFTAMELFYFQINQRFFTLLLNLLYESFVREKEIHFFDKLNLNKRKFNR